MQCPNCQHWNEPGSRFCEECGTELPQATAPSVARVVLVNPADEAPVPPPPPQDLIPQADPPLAPYEGPHLVLKSTGSIFKLSDAAVIGREDPALQIDFDGYPDGKYISHRHAQITNIGGKYYIEDLGSSNHTYVNGIKLAQGQAEPIDEGDVIKLGKIELVFHEA
ncbi:MAG: FHA domain-containing protein [Chloroflexi bacterium]|uniref:FHA domain-containing protein n=1 Tax=Candidatus Flexifilum breve TaxID=3140694 RepID=UPI00313724FA|nr:FHA domain-containing protein [Chloroflexota bacterium]